MTSYSDTPTRRQRAAQAVAAFNGCPLDCPSCAPTVDVLLADALPDPALPEPRQEESR